MKAQYTTEEKIEWYFKKLQIAMAAGGTAKSLFEAIYYAEQANDIKIRIKQLLDEK